MEGSLRMDRLFPPPASGADALRTAHAYVTKIGGENAVQLAANADVIRKRMQNNHTQILAVSALRSSDPRWSAHTHPAAANRSDDGTTKPGFNTTSHLIAIGRTLQSGDASTRTDAEDMAKRIAAFTHAAVEEQAGGDGLLASKTSTIESLRTIIRSRLEDPHDPRSLTRLIRSAQPEDIHQRGEDWLHTGPEGVHSLTGHGETLAQALTAAYLADRGVAPAIIDLAAQADAIEEALRFNAPELARKKLEDATREALGRALSTHRVIVAGGYAPLLGSERGYSDKTGALLAHLLREMRWELVYLVEKQTPIMSADPREIPEARVVRRMTPFLARELFGNTRGADAGALHPEALDLLAGDGIDIVVLNPNEAPRDDNITLINEFHPDPDGVEMVQWKPVPKAIQVATAAMIGRRGFEADLARWFTEQGVSLQHIATSEGSISYTFDHGTETDALVRDLRTFLEQQYGVDGGSVVREVDHLGAVYCLGNNMRCPGQAAKATLALHGAGVNIRMITQGLNECVMAFLVDRDDAPRAVQALHDVFITLPEPAYDALCSRFHAELKGAVVAAKAVSGQPGANLEH